MIKIVVDPFADFAMICVMKPFRQSHGKRTVSFMNQADAVLIGDISSVVNHVFVMSGMFIYMRKPVFDNNICCAAGSPFFGGVDTGWQCEEFFRKNDGKTVIRRIVWKYADANWLCERKAGMFC